MYPRGSHIRSARGSRGVGGRGENYPTTTDASATNRGSPPSYSGMPPQHRHHLPVAIHVEADRAAHPTASQPIRRSPIQISIPTSTELQTQAPPPHHHHQQQQQSAPISYARHTLPQVGSGCMYASSSLAHQGGTLPSCSSRESLARPATATPLHLAHSGSGSGDFHHVNSTISISSPITSSATIYISNLSTHIQNSHQLAPFVPHAGLTSLRVKRSLRHVDIGFAEYESVAAARDALRWFHTVGTLYHLVQHACASSDPSQSGFVPHWYVDLASMDGGRPPTPSGGGGPEDLADAATLQQLHEVFLEKLPLPYKDEQVYLRLLMPNLRYFARFPVLRNAQPLITTWSRGTPTYRPTTVGQPATTTSSPITHTGDFIIHAESQTMAPMYSATATTTTTGATGGWMDPSQLPSSSSTVYQTSYSHTAHTPDSAMMMKMPTTTTTMEATSLHSPMLGIEPLHGGSPLTVPRQLSCGGAEIAMDGVVLDTTNLGGRRTLLLRQRYTRHVGDAPTRAESFPSFSSHLGDEFGLGPHMSDIDVISHVEPTFFQQRFPNEFVGFRLFQDPPQSGGCFVMFSTHNIALRCMESLMRHPRLLEVFDISFADTELRHPQVCGSSSSQCWAAATSSATVGGGGAQGVGLVSSSNASRAISSSEEM